MMAFALAAGALLLASMAFVLWPLWAGRQVAGSRREANIAVYEQHAAEIDRELTAGQITLAEAEGLRNDLDAQLLKNVDDAPRSGSYVTKRPWLASTVVVVGFVVLAAGLYGWIGDTRGLTVQQQPDIAALVTKMKAQLATAPDDLRTRALLGQVQMARKNYAAAAATFADLNARLSQPNNAFLLVEARARVLANNGRVGARAQTLYNQVLASDPDNVEALWFTGLAALAAGKSDVAIQRWQRLLAQDVPDEFRASVERRLAEAMGTTPALEP